MWIVQTGLCSYAINNPSGRWVGNEYGSTRGRIVAPFKTTFPGITQSLETALRHLRHQNTEGTVWIDAICINRKDDAEKAVQSQTDAVDLRSHFPLRYLGR